MGRCGRTRATALLAVAAVVAVVVVVAEEVVVGSGRCRRGRRRSVCSCRGRASARARRRWRAGGVLVQEQERVHRTPQWRLGCTPGYIAGLVHGYDDGFEIAAGVTLVGQEGVVFSNRQAVKAESGASTRSTLRRASELRGGRRR